MIYHVTRPDIEAFCAGLPPNDLQTLRTAFLRMYGISPNPDKIARNYATKTYVYLDEMPDESGNKAGHAPIVGKVPMGQQFVRFRRTRTGVPRPVTVPHRKGTSEHILEKMRKEIATYQFEAADETITPEQLLQYQKLIEEHLSNGSNILNAGKIREEIIRERAKKRKKELAFDWI